MTGNENKQSFIVTRMRKKVSIEYSILTHILETFMRKKL